jgi:hypothetical protein
MPFPPILASSFEAIAGPLLIVAAMAVLGSLVAFAVSKSNRAAKLRAGPEPLLLANEARPIARPVNRPTLRMNSGAPTMTAAASVGGSVSSRGSAEMAMPSEQQRRGSLRRDGQAVSVQVALFDGQGEKIPGEVIDRSRGGLRMVVGQAVPPTTLLRIRAPHAPENVGWIQLEVRRCDQVNGKWELGCQFTQDHPWSVLLLFG